MYSRYPDYQPFIPLNNRLHKENNSESQSYESERQRENINNHNRHEMKTHSNELHKGGKELLGSNNLLGGKGLLGGLLNRFNLNLDSGDILILLIILFLSQESEDDDILMILGLVFLMGGF